MVSDRTKRCRTLTSSSSSSPLSLPTLHFDLIPEILCRLPVKFLLQFQCVCKSWKSLISDPKFVKKQLSISTTCTLHCINKSDSEHVLIKSYSFDDYVFTNITQTQYPSRGSYVMFVGSCNGILCLVNNSINVLVLQLWNPSIRKFKEFPHLIGEEPKYPSMYEFGYDPISHNYKVVVVFGDVTHDDLSEDELINEVAHEVKVHTLGTDSWKRFGVSFCYFLLSSYGETCEWHN
ncbi:F-box/kelch-repeat protein [Trifolium repens]|nr:F-box/kelch-repeat protein [Trifolium repens]